MCGRIIQAIGPVNLAIIEGLDTRNHRLDNFPRRYNGAPSQELLVIRENHKTGERTLEPLRWGLIPYWCKDPKGGRRPINAMAETVHLKPMFREAYERRRCIVPIDGFFEWKAIKGKAKQPYAIAMKDGSPSPRRLGRQADGYTLLYVNAAVAYSTVLYPNPGYDPLKSFSPVAALASWSFFLFASADVPAGTVRELIAYAKANPGQINIGLQRGQAPQVVAEKFKAISGAPFNAVPYQQISQLTADLLAGRIHAYFGTGAGPISLAQQGKLRALAYTGVTRHPALPQVLTVIETGLPQLASIQDWMGIVAPAGTPPIPLPYQSDLTI